MSLFENAAGLLSAFNQNNFIYRVTPRPIPTTVDVVDLFLPSSPNTPFASALIGPDGQSLIFYRFLGGPGNANPTRLLGLALRQTPP
jgi:hypothetical protein